MGFYQKISPLLEKERKVLKKALATFILSVFFCNFVYAETLFYEDYSFYGELITDIAVNDVIRKQEIQVAFPNFSKSKIPFVVNGHAYYKKIDGKPVISLELDKISLGAQRYIPAEILVTGVNRQKLKNAAIHKQSKFVRGFVKVNTYTRDVIMFPINRYKSNPTFGKPTANTFIMLSEPVYFALGAVLFAISPLTTLICMDKTAPDIRRGSIIEFEFLKEMSRQEFEKALQLEAL